MPERNLRFGFDSKAGRMACVAVSLIMAVPMLLIGHVSYVVFMVVQVALITVLRLIKTLVLSLAQGFINTWWLIKTIIGANL